MTDFDLAVAVEPNADKRAAKALEQQLRQLEAELQSVLGEPSACQRLQPRPLAKHNPELRRHAQRDPRQGALQLIRPGAEVGVLGV